MEPPNELYPKTYVQEIKNLSKLGLEIEVLDENEKIRMNSLLGVGQGSERESYLVIMKWNGKSKKSISFCWKRSLF